MSKPVHALWVSQSANESDNQEWVDALCCDLEQIENWEGDKNWKYVTCKRCLKIIEKRKKNDSHSI